MALTLTLSGQAKPQGRPYHAKYLTPGLELISVHRGVIVCLQQTSKALMQRSGGPSCPPVAELLLGIMNEPADL